MRQILATLATRFFPRLKTMSGRERAYGVADVIGALYTTPIAVAGLLWLANETHWALIASRWPLLLLILALLFVFERLDFFIFVEVTTGTYAEWVWSLWSIITWSSVFMFGPGALWITVIWRLISFFSKWRRANTPDWRWNLARHLTLYLATTIFGILVALSCYRRWGGSLPLPMLSVEALLPGFGATLIWLLFSAALWTPILAYFSSVREFAWTHKPLLTLVRFLAVTMGWRLLVDPFAVFAAGLYAQNGPGGYLFFVGGLLITGYLAHQLSEAVQRSQLRSRELEKLERLGRAIINMPPDASTLPQVLAEHLCNMFPYCHVEIRLFPEQIIFHHPNAWSDLDEATWKWLHQATETDIFKPAHATPWGEHLSDKAVIVAPILDIKTGKPIGGIYLERFRNTETVTDLLPAVQTLTAQIASALHSARVYQQTLALQKVESELALAGQIQASFLPKDLPQIAGWQLAAGLQPAQETSGDFYDLIPLSNGQLGVVIADVADKGMGAALYMALSRTLIRTYALQYRGRPDYVLKVANRRILMDTDTDLFVTTFYGVLDPQMGTLTYANAGHNPPLVFRSGDGAQPYQLQRTGIPLGIFEGESWKQEQLILTPGDTLIFYTDGIPDAENTQGEFFGMQRLLNTARAHLGQSAGEIEKALLDSVRQFADHNPPFDDIALMVLVREEDQRGRETP